jgi:hypothetical protein
MIALTQEALLEHLQELSQEEDLELPSSRKKHEVAPASMRAYIRGQEEWREYENPSSPAFKHLLFIYSFTS